MKVNECTSNKGILINITQILSMCRKAKLYTNLHTSENEAANQKKHYPRNCTRSVKESWQGISSPEGHRQLKHQLFSMSDIDLDFSLKVSLSRGTGLPTYLLINLNV